MMSKIFADSFKVSLKTGPDVADVTGVIQDIVDRSGISTGTAAAFVAGSTGSVTTIEFEPGVVEDLKEAVNRIAPPSLDYAHEQAWHDGNGHSHVQAALLGPSITVPVRSGRLRLGTWQQVVIINHDNRSRKRVVEITVVGT